MNPETLAHAYASVAIDLCYAGGQFDRAARFLSERRLQAAEDCIQRGLDGLSRAMEMMPRVPEQANQLTEAV